MFSVISDNISSVQLEHLTTSDELLDSYKLFRDNGYEPGLGLEQNLLVLDLAEKYGVAKSRKILEQLQELQWNSAGIE